MVRQGRPTRRKRPCGGRIPNYDRGRWTGPDVWTTGNGEPSVARLYAERLGYDWAAQ